MPTQIGENRAKKMLKANELVLCMGVNQLRTPNIAMIAAACGFDAVYIDLELPQTTRRDGVARAGQCLCQTARSIRRKPLLFNANTQTETFVAPCRDFITFLFVCSHAANIRHEDTGLPWDIGADVP